MQTYTHTGTHTHHPTCTNKYETEEEEWGGWRGRWIGGQVGLHSSNIGLEGLDLLVESFGSTMWWELTIQ
jgi:hypothetical protein